MGEVIKNSSEKNKESYNVGNNTKLKLERKEIGTDCSYKRKVVWSNAIGFFILHALGLWGLGILLTGAVTFKTFAWTILTVIVSSFGITAGAHRLYSHRSYKATPLLRAILILAQTVAGQNSIYTWCRDHRLHHRYSDTDADPHNINRGFFFSHVGWLLSKKHPLVLEYGRQTDMSDLEADWMVMFQFKYYYYLYFIFGFLLPIWVPVYYFGETWRNSFLVPYALRYIYVLNGTWLVNSAAHVYGTRPYDKTLKPVENWFVSLITNGEGWHNYHHAFPWDYRTSELGTHYNLSTKFIDLCAKLGLAYDLKRASDEMVKKRILRSGS